MSEVIPAQETPKADATASAPAAPVVEAKPTVEAKADAVVEVPAETPKPVAETKEVLSQVPEKYDLKLPKDSILDQAYVDKLLLEAKEKGLTNEQAQGILERDSSLKSAFVTEQRASLKVKADGWFVEASKDSEIGGDAFKENVELAKRALNVVGSEKLIKELNETGLGNHPELIRAFMKMGRMMGNDKLVVPGAQPRSRPDMADLLYPTTKQKE